MFVARYVRPLVPEGIASWPDLLTFTDATSNANEFPDDCCADAGIPTLTTITKIAPPIALAAMHLV